MVHKAVLRKLECPFSHRYHQVDSGQELPTPDLDPIYWLCFFFGLSRYKRCEMHSINEWATQ